MLATLSLKLMLSFIPAVLLKLGAMMATAVFFGSHTQSRGALRGANSEESGQGLLQTSSWANYPQRCPKQQPGGSGFCGPEVSNSSAQLKLQSTYFAFLVVFVLLVTSFAQDWRALRPGGDMPEAN